MVKNLLRKFFAFLGIRVLTRNSSIEQEAYIKSLEYELQVLRPTFSKYLLCDSKNGSLRSIFKKSMSQFSQDIFVLAVLGWKSKGFFVEFGALDGIQDSNTYLLEKDFQWEGILAEPQIESHKSLRFNRDCRIDTRAVYSTDGEFLEFYRTRFRGLSTLAKFYDSEGKNSNLRTISNWYHVETISLNSLLFQHSAPEEIDYISIDTEGSELEILRAFNFKKYRVKVWTVEHNFSATREQVHNLMRENGYRRVFSEISQVDDWFISEDIALSFESIN